MDKTLSNLVSHAIEAVLKSEKELRDEFVDLNEMAKKDATDMLEEAFEYIKSTMPSLFENSVFEPLKVKFMKEGFGYRIKQLGEYGQDWVYIVVPHITYDVDFESLPSIKSVAEIAGDIYVFEEGKKDDVKAFTNKGFLQDNVYLFKKIASQYFLLNLESSDVD